MEKIKITNLTVFRQQQFRHEQPVRYETHPGKSKPREISRLQGAVSVAKISVSGMDSFESRLTYLIAISNWK